MNLHVGRRCKAHAWGPCEKAARPGGAGSCVSKERICAPKKLRCTRQSKPPSSACPPSFWPVQGKVYVVVTEAHMMCHACHA